MPRLDSRVAKLEQKRTVAEDMTIVVRFVRPGNLHPCIDALTGPHGEGWQRLADESEQGLIDRATSEVRRNYSCNAVLLMTK